MLPFVSINVATTADGKLAPVSRKFVPFSSKQDQRLLLELRTRADAVMAGARTVDLMPVSLGPGGERYRKMRLKNGLAEYNLRVVVSGRGTLDPNAAIFKKRFSPIIVLVSGRASQRDVRALERVADEVKSFGGERIDFTAALKWLNSKWKVRTLLCEGGGEVNAGLFAEGLVHEVYHTLCPVIFGGAHAPTMADGRGVSAVKYATKLKLKSLKRVGDELFLVYRVENKPWR